MGHPEDPISMGRITLLDPQDSLTFSSGGAEFVTPAKRIRNGRTVELYGQRTLLNLSTPALGIVGGQLVEGPTVHFLTHRLFDISLVIRGASGTTPCELYIPTIDFTLKTMTDTLPKQEGSDELVSSHRGWRYDAKPTLSYRFFIGRDEELIRQLLFTIGNTESGLLPVF